MKKRWFGLLGLVAVLGLPAPAWGQDDMSFDDAGGTGDDMSFDDSGGTGDDMSFDDSGGTGDDMSFDDGSGTGDTGDTGDGGLAGLLGTPPTTTPEETPEEDVLDTAALEEPEIWAVQQSYVLRDGRFELTPYYGISLNDPFVTHNAFGIKLGWYITEVLGLGASFQWYQGLDAESEDNFHIPRSFRLVVPINEYQLAAHLHFSYVPIYGKLTIFNEWIFHWDCFIEGGVGFLYTRPIPVVDPEVRTFDFGIRVAANIGIGARIFLTKFVAIYVQYTDYMYMEKLENLNIAPSETTDQTSAEWGQSRYNPSTWLGESKFTNDMMLLVGASIFFPFTFDYEYPK
jgi:outer membrane beta-barrel protein